MDSSVEALVGLTFYGALLALTIWLGIYTWKTAVRKDRNPWPWLVAYLLLPLYIGAIMINCAGLGTYSLRKAKRAELIEASQRIKAGA